MAGAMATAAEGDGDLERLPHAMTANLNGKEHVLSTAADFEAFLPFAAPFLFFPWGLQARARPR